MGNVVAERWERSGAALRVASTKQPVRDEFSCKWNWRPRCHWMYLLSLVRTRSHTPHQRIKGWKKCEGTLLVPRLIHRSASSVAISLYELLSLLWFAKHSFSVRSCDFSFLFSALSQDRLSRRQQTTCCFGKCEHSEIRSLWRCRISKAHPVQGCWKHWHSKLPHGRTDHNLVMNTPFLYHSEEEFVQASTWTPSDLSSPDPVRHVESKAQWWERNASKAER